MMMADERLCYSCCFWRTKEFKLLLLLPAFTMVSIELDSIVQSSFLDDSASRREPQIPSACVNALKTVLLENPEDRKLERGALGSSFLRNRSMWT